jgi:hypothetical protein
MISFRACRVWTTTALVLVLFVVLTSSSAPAAGARHEKRAKCPASAADSVIANGDAEVYVALGRGADEGLEVAFGCAYAQGRSYRLGIIEKCIGSSAGGCGFTLEHEILAGPVIAYAEAVKGSRKDGVFVRDLRNGRLLHQATSVVGQITDVVVKSDGAVVWIVENEKLSSMEIGYYEVYAIDKSGKRVLASGNDINPFSLALSSNTYRGAPPEVYWSQGGKAFSTPLN